eukprot:scaffold92320_cov60-Phaeocystis_antarctica.AAC.3
MFGSVRRLATRLSAPEVASLEGIEPIASRFELTMGAQRATSRCPCEATALLLASPGPPLQLSATTDPIARSILALRCAVARESPAREARGQQQLRSCLVGNNRASKVLWPVPQFSPPSSKVRSDAL